MAITKKTKDLAAGLTDDQKTKIRDFGDKIGTEALKDRLGVESPTIEQPSAVETPAPIETPTLETPTLDTPPIETAPIETPEIETPPIDPTATPDPSLVDQGEQAKQKEQDLASQALEEAKQSREKSITDTKRGFALGKAKFDENKANYSNYDEVNTKYNAVIDEITASMSDTGVIDESVYQSLASKYGITIEEAKNPNRILDQVQLTEEGKEATGVNAFEAGIEDLTKENERRKEDLNLQLEQAREGYGNQMSNALESVNDVITGLTSSGAASGLFRSTALSDRVQDVREGGDKTFSRIAAASNRTEGQIHESLTRITDDFNQSVEEARKDFDDNFKQVHNENIVNLQAAGLNFTGDKLIEEIKRINEEFGIESQSISTNYLNNVSKINQIVQDNISIAEQLANQEEEKELKGYNEYLENDGILLQSSTLAEITQRVQEGTLSVESAQNLRKIMQTSIQSTLGALAPLELGDIDNINYLLEQGYTPEQAIALMQESFDKFQPKEEVEVQKPFTVSEGSSVYDPVSGTFKTPTGNVVESGDFRNLTSELQRPAGSTNVGEDTNNPGNIMAETEKGREYAKSLGAIGYYSSPNGRTYAVFPDINTGLAATRADIQTKLNGGSYWVNESTNLGQLATGWTVGPNAPANENAISNFERISGYSRDTPISQIPEDVIIDAIFKNEGVDANSGGVDMSYLSQAQDVEVDNSSNFRYAETLTASDRTKFLKERGLEDDYISYKAEQGTSGADFSDISDITDINFPEKTTQYKTDSYGYGNRMDTSSDLIDVMANKYANSFTLSEKIGGAVPNFLKTDDRQQFEQAQRNFVNAILRKESGAVISDQEFDNAAKQYFPQPGDSVAVMDQKKVNRNQVIENMYRNAGKDDQGRNIVDIYKNLRPDRIVEVEETEESIEEETGAGSTVTASNGVQYTIKVK